MTIKMLSLKHFGSVELGNGKVSGKKAVKCQCSEKILSVFM